MRANTLTVFNLILAIFGTLTLAFGDWRDALFLGVLLANEPTGAPLTGRQPDAFAVADL